MSVTNDYALPDYVKPGAVLRIVYGGSARKQPPIHIRALVDDQVVYRYLSRRKVWVYKIISQISFGMMHFDGMLKVIKQGDENGTG